MSVVRQTLLLSGGWTRSVKRKANRCMCGSGACVHTSRWIVASLVCAPLPTTSLVVLCPLACRFASGTLLARLERVGCTVHFEKLLRSGLGSDRRRERFL
jgi:hypothetical protein